jgi:hypothetical protein
MEMIGYRATAGLSLLCALAFAAFSAQSVSAANATNTTAFTCVKEGGAKDFKDAHCDEKVTPGTGGFGHVTIPVNEITEVEYTNAKTKNATTESTPGFLKTVLAGVKTEGFCNTIIGKGKFANEEPSPKVHTGSGTGNIELSSCTLLKPAKCTFNEPIVINGIAQPVEGLGAGKNEMGGEIKPAEGEIFTTTSFKGAECSLKEKPFEVKGTVVATGAPAPTEKHSGATAILTNAMTKETLSIGGKPAEISAAMTVRPVPVKGVEQNPLTSTTVT